MVSGFRFVDVFVSEITMGIAALLFLLCGVFLIRKRKPWKVTQKRLVLAALIVTGIYLACILCLVLLWG